MDSFSWFWEFFLITLHGIAFCVMTRFARGWWQTLLVYGLYVAYRLVCCVIPDQPWFPPQSEAFYAFYWYVVNWPPILALLLVMGRGSRGRLGFMFVYYLAQSLTYLQFTTALYLMHPSWQRAAFSLLLAVGVNAYFIFRTVPALYRIPENANWRGPILMMSGIFVLLFAGFVWPNTMIGNSLSEILVGGLFCLAVVFMLPVFTEYFAGRAARDREQQITDSFTHLAHELEIRREAITAARRMRHDLRHHLLTLLELMEHGKWEGAHTYLKSLSADRFLAESLPATYCTHEICNAVVNGFAEKAKAAHESFSFAGGLGDAVAIPDVDLVTVLANLLENAVHAAGVGGEVACVIREKASSIGISVTNTVPVGFALSEDGLPTPEPGIGIASVKTALARHGGRLIYKLEGNLLSSYAYFRKLSGEEVSHANRSL